MTNKICNMASTGIGFRWLDILEKEFDTNFVDLEIYLGELESDDPDIVCNARQKMCALSSCFAQLTHKAQTIFQNSAKVEAELVNLRAELVEAKAKRDCLEQEIHTIVLELHAAQLANKGNASSNAPNHITLEPAEIDRIRKRLQEEIEKSPRHRASISEDNGHKLNPDLLEISQLRTENSQLSHENTALRNSILALQSEVYGAKLAAKYLDKELAGRIQQLQLLGREMRGDIRDKLWRQLESEILLQRHKTVVRACRRNNGCTPNGPQKPDLSSGTVQGIGETRLVTVKRSHGQGLGISITGGREHGVPILISELEPNGPAAICNQLYIGDAILSVNGIDLKQACHKEAVQVLQQQTGDCILEVQYVASEDSDSNSLSEDGYNFQYRFFDTEVCDSNDGISLHPLQQNLANTPTAPRTPESNEQSRRYSVDNASHNGSPLNGDIHFDNKIIDSDQEEIIITQIHHSSNDSSAATTQIELIEQKSESNFLDEKSIINNCSYESETNDEVLENTVNISDVKSDDETKNVLSVTEITSSELNNFFLHVSKEPNLNYTVTDIIQSDNSQVDVVDQNLQDDVVLNNLDSIIDNAFFNTEPQNILDQEIPSKTGTSSEESDVLSETCNNNEHEQFFSNNRTIIDIAEVSADLNNENAKLKTDFNCSSNSLLYTTESDNASSPIQTSTENFMSSDVVSNNSESPKSILKNLTDETSQLNTAYVVKNFKTELYEPKVYNDALIGLTKDLESTIFLEENFNNTDTNTDTVIDEYVANDNFLDNKLNSDYVSDKNDNFQKPKLSSSPSYNFYVKSDHLKESFLNSNFFDENLAEFSKIGDSLNAFVDQHCSKNILDLKNFTECCISDDIKHYSSNSESFSNATSPKSAQSLNISCPNESYESSPVHKDKTWDIRKNTRKMKIRKNHGVKTIQSIFRTNEYLSSDISSTNSDFNDDVDNKSSKFEPALIRAHSPAFVTKNMKKLSKGLKTSKIEHKSKHDIARIPRLKPESPTSENIKSPDKTLLDSQQRTDAEKAFEQNIHAFLTETFSKNEVQLPNLKIINSYETQREKDFRFKIGSQMNRTQRFKSVETLSENQMNKEFVGDDNVNKRNIDNVCTQTPNDKNDLLLKQSPGKQNMKYRGISFFDDVDNLSYSVQESDFSDDNLESQSRKQTNLVQYGRTTANINEELAQFNAPRLDTKVYIDEQKLKENKEKLLERYVRANHQKMLEGSGDPDFGTPV